MPHPLLELITSPDPGVRNQSLDAHCARASAAELVAACDALEAFRRSRDNLYERVRALFFLYAIHRFHLPAKLPADRAGLIPFRGYEHLLERRFEEALDQFLAAQKAGGPGDALCSALAVTYQRLGFQTLADQVRRSVRSVRGNQWMFRMGHPADHPLRVRPELLRRQPDGSFPVLRERTPVRMDLSHSGWSDIFFLGMDFPEGARVLNVSIDLGVHGRDAAPRPPVEAFLRVIDEPVLRLTSVDLGASADIRSLAEVFDFARDYLGLLKAAVIASGLVPPGIEGSGQDLADLLARVVGPGLGLEIVSHVNDIPKGSRLAVSTNLLASLIAACMRATGQAESLTGALTEPERRLVLARALLGEWLGGSGGGWQDSGGVWPGIKLITGVPAAEGDPEFGISRGRLMPAHHILGRDEVSAATRARLQESLVLVHGGMAQNVGPILEMVTEKYLLRSGPEWAARQQAIGGRAIALSGTCSVCAVQGQVLFDFFSHWQHALATDPRAQAEFAAGRGLCPVHTWQFQKVTAPQDLSAGYVPLMQQVLEALRRLPEEGTDHKAAAIDALLPSPEACPACRLLHRTVGPQIRLFLAQMATAEGRDLFARSPGLCLPHLRLALAMAETPEAADLLREEVKRLEETLEDLHAYVLKREALRRGLLSASEENAWRRALVQLVGEPTAQYWG